MLIFIHRSLEEYLIIDKEIIAKICPNKQNGQDNKDDYLDKKMYKERYAAEIKKKSFYHLIKALLF